MRVGQFQLFNEKCSPIGAIAWAAASRALWTTVSVAALTGCSAAPSHSILGSYFPSWMICALVGLIVAVVARQVFVATGIDRTIPAPLLVYLMLTIAAAFATWLIWLDGA